MAEGVKAMGTKEMAGVQMEEEVQVGMERVVAVMAKVEVVMVRAV